MSILLLDGQRRTDLDWNLIGTSGFFSAYRVMTTIGVHYGNPIDFDRHLQRLFLHAAKLRFTGLPSAEILKFECDSLVSELSSNPLTRLRIILFLDAKSELHRIIHMEIVNIIDVQTMRNQGIKLSTEVDIHREKSELVKTGILGLKGVQLEEARKQGFDDILWCNSESELTETTMANVFLIGRTGDLVEIGTPPLSSGVMAGVTRRRIKELLNGAQIPVTERIITQEEVPGFDEAFATSSVKGLVPITQIGRHKLHTLRPNAIFHHVSRLYRTWLKSTLPNYSERLQKDQLL